MARRTRYSVGYIRIPQCNQLLSVAGSIVPPIQLEVAATTKPSLGDQLTAWLWGIPYASYSISSSMYHVTSLHPAPVVRSPPLERRTLSHLAKSSPGVRFA